MGYIVGVFSTLTVIWVYLSMWNARDKLVDSILEGLSNSGKDLQDIQRALLAACVDR